MKRFLRKLYKSLMGNKKKKDLKHPYCVGINISIMPTSKIDSLSRIHSYSYVGDNCRITKSTIGRYTSIGDNVTIGPGEHDLHTISTSHWVADVDDWYNELTQKDCIIGNDVWIGVDSIIKRGVTIGNGAVVGANSFVNKDVPAFAVVAGSPAKIVKYRFAPNIQRIIAETEWWDKDLDEAKLIIKKLTSELVNIQ